MLNFIRGNSDYSKKALIIIFFLEKTLLKMVRSVSEDKLYDTIEFNEFLQMMGKHQQNEVNMDALMEAFK